MKDNLISVIVPIYNLENEIVRCIESIEAQTYSNIEIILVNDGSTDNSANLIEEIAKKDYRIKVIHKENGGVTSARLEGIRSAIGEWIGFVDGDDYIEPNMYELLLSNALKYNADISHCGYQNVFPSRVDYYYNTGRIVQQDNLMGLKDLIEGTFVEPGLWNKLFRKDLFHNLLNNELMDLSIKNTEDLLMNYYLFKESSKSIYQDICPYHYIVRKGSSTASFMKINLSIDVIKVNEILVKNTADEEILYHVAIQRLVYSYINGAKIKKNSSYNYENEYVDFCRKKLGEYKNYILNGNFSLSFKTKTLLCSSLPSIYRCVHRFYEKITGVDKKYEVS